MGTVTTSVAVQLTTAGAPLHVEVNGRVYRVAAEPARWFERRKWWAEERRVEKGRGDGLVDREVWRLQVQLSSRAPLHTIYLVHHDSGRWELVQVHDQGQFRASA